MVHFAVDTYALQKPGIEMEVLFGLSNCQAHKTKLHAFTGYPSHTGEIPSNPLYQQSLIQGAFVRAIGETGKPVEEDLLGIVREFSRLFQISAPDDHLRFYLH